MGIPLLILCLEGPLQSWGERSRWTYRDTATIPTKSGVIGLIGCAMGLKRDDKRLVELDNQLRMGVRVDKDGDEIIDYHTITGDINTANGEKRGTKGKVSTILSYRYYLQDAKFLVLLQGKEEILKECKNALMNPQWTIYLGRKSCVPTRPIFEKLIDEYETIKQAIQEYPLLCSVENAINDSVDVMCEIEDINGTVKRQDQYPDNTGRMFGFRTVEVFQSIIYQGVKK